MKKFGISFIIDKCIVLILCILLYVFSFEKDFYIVPIIISVSLSALITYFTNSIPRILLLSLFIVVCIIDPSLFIFLPLLLYDFYFESSKIALLLSLGLAVFSFSQLPLLASVFTLAIAGFAALNKWRTDTLSIVILEQKNLRDETKEMSLSLRRKNNELKEKQDYEITVATLNERNRIARDIHDGVGHTLTSAILQTGAIITQVSDSSVKEKLYNLKETLSSGMNSIRDSVHNLHGESIDLNLEIRKIVDNYDFCKVNLQYDINSQINSNVKYCFIQIVKESLSNVAKHSNAKTVRIRISELPALWQLMIRDDGNISKSLSFPPNAMNNDSLQFTSLTNGEGIGLRNIKDRVESLGGLVNINLDNGFMIFISIPKGRDD